MFAGLSCSVIVVLLVCIVMFMVLDCFVTIGLLCSSVRFIELFCRYRSAIAMSCYVP